MRVTYEEEKLITGWLLEEMLRLGEEGKEELAVTERRIEMGSVVLIQQGPDMMRVEAIRRSMLSLDAARRRGAAALIETSAVIRARLMAHRAEKEGLG